MTRIRSRSALLLCAFVTALAVPAGAQTFVNLGPNTGSVFQIVAAPSNGSALLAIPGNDGGGLFLSTDTGATWTSIAGDLPDRHDVWAVVQDHVNPNLLFAGTEFGVFTSIDGGGHWIALKGGVPVAQVRDLAIQRRENDLVIATFGRGFFVLDDYSPLREMSAQALSEDVHLFALRDASLFNPLGQAPAGAAGLGAMAGNWTAPNPPFGATRTA